MMHDAVTSGHVHFGLSGATFSETSLLLHAHVQIIIIIIITLDKGIFLFLFSASDLFMCIVKVFSKRCFKIF